MSSCHQSIPRVNIIILFLQFVFLTGDFGPEQFSSLSSKKFKRERQRLQTTILRKWFPNLVEPGTGSMEDNFAMKEGGGQG